MSDELCALAWMKAQRTMKKNFIDDEIKQNKLNRAFVQKQRKTDTELLLFFN